MSGQTGKRLRHLCLTLLLCAGLASPTTAETKALLIGVSDYDAASGVPDLRGPANDVRLLRQVLA
ncbi:MAG: caspase family protein, partial [Rhodobacteraceae bacterium]|nr:caspase family protein [Paracoccaceae bacterium]